MGFSTISSHISIKSVHLNSQYSVLFFWLSLLSLPLNIDRFHSFHWCWSLYLWCLDHFSILFFTEPQTPSSPIPILFLLATSISMQNYCCGNLYPCHTEKLDTRNGHCSENISLYDICIISWYWFLSQKQEYPKSWTWILHHKQKNLDMIKLQHYKCSLLFFPFSWNFPPYKKGHRKRDRSIKKHVFKSDLTAYQPAFCTYWNNPHLSFTYCIYLCNSSLCLPILSLNPYISAIQILPCISNQICTLCPWTYTDTLHFHYCWFPSHLLIISGSLKDSSFFQNYEHHLFPSLFLSNFHHFYPCEITVEQNYTTLTPMNWNTNSKIFSKNNSLFDICIVC